MQMPDPGHMKAFLAAVAAFVAVLYFAGYIQTLSLDQSVSAEESTSLKEGFPDFVRADNKTGLQMNSSYSAQDFVGHSGVYVNDFNNDGWEDVLGVDGDKAVLFENQEGEFQKTGRLSEYRNIAAAHFFDYDNSGYDDILLLRQNAEPLLLENRQGEGFKKIEAGFDQRLTRPYGAASADYDRDGCLDIFITQWGGDTLYNQAQRVHDEHPDYRPTAETSYPNYFYEGDCESFEQANEKANIGGEGYFTFTASFTDFSGNNYPDIYMPNDFGRDIFYRNNGNGTFTPVDIGPESDRNAMSSETGFFNNDSQPDIFVTNVYYPENFTDEHEKKLVGDNVPLPHGNNMFVKTGDGFEDQASEYNIRKGGWGWASTFSDFSNNGRQSIIHATDNRHYDYRAPREYRQISVFRRQENGNFNRLDSIKYGFEVDASRGVSKIDFNNDGKLDLVASTHQRTRHNSEPLKLYENTNASGSFLQIMLEPGNYISTNTRLLLNTSKGLQRRVLNSRSDFMSQESQMAHFGLEGNITSLKVSYPDGEELEFESIKSDRRYIIDRGEESIEVMG